MIVMLGLDRELFYWVWNNLTLHAVFDNKECNDDQDFAQDSFNTDYYFVLGKLHTNRNF